MNNSMKNVIIFWIDILLYVKIQIYRYKIALGYDHKIVSLEYSYTC